MVNKTKFMEEKKMETQDTEKNLSLFDVIKGVGILYDLIRTDRAYDRQVMEINRRTYNDCDKFDKKTEEIESRVAALTREFYLQHFVDKPYEEQKKILIDEQTKQGYYKCLDGMINIVRQQKGDRYERII